MWDDLKFLRRLRSEILCGVFCLICSPLHAADAQEDLLEYLPHNTSAVIVLHPSAAIKSLPDYLVPTELLDARMQMQFGVEISTIETAVYWTAHGTLHGGGPHGWIIRQVDGKVEPPAPKAPYRLKDLEPGLFALSRHKKSLALKRSRNADWRDRFRPGWGKIHCRGITDPRFPGSLEDDVATWLNLLIDDAATNRVFDLTRSFDFQLTLGDPIKVHLRMEGTTAANAAALKNEVGRLADAGHRQFQSSAKRQKRSSFADTRAQATYFEKLSARVRAAIQPEVEGRHVTVAGEIPLRVFAVPAVIVLTTPPYRRDDPPDYTRLSVNHLKQIGLAIHNYYETHKKLPPRFSPDVPKNKGLSWRVHILPYLEEGDLYRRFRLDEPWDSPHNLKLADEMPAVYRSPGDKSIDHKTRYLTVAGDDTLLGNGQQHTFSEVKDGLTNTLMVVEVDASHSVPWTSPQDVVFNRQNPSEGILPRRVEETIQIPVLLGDGAVRRVRSTISADTWRALITRNGGELPPEEIE